MKAESIQQGWSRGQCNIVDHRKLVSVINNDKNKQRWVCSCTFCSRTATTKWGFPSVGQDSPGPFKTWKKSVGLPESLSMHRDLCRGKNSIPGPLFLCSCSQVIFWKPTGGLGVFLLCFLSGVWRQPHNNIQFNLSHISDWRLDFKQLLSKQREYKPFVFIYLYSSLCEECWDITE